MTIKWSRWTSVHDACDQGAPAVYKIRLVRDASPVPIARFLGVDHSGTLAIGHASRLENRHSQFSAALRRGRGHSELNLLHLLERRTPWRQYFGTVHYEFCFQLLKTVGTAKAL
jgi:hypothetical protein